jgi:hypothetical protein
LLDELSRKAEDNATSRWLHRIPPTAEAGGFQTTGLKFFAYYCLIFGLFSLLVKSSFF